MHQIKNVQLDHKKIPVNVTRFQGTLKQMSPKTFLTKT